MIFVFMWSEFLGNQEGLDLLSIAILKMQLRQSNGWTTKLLVGVR
jgi:hypothetical protein